MASRLATGLVVLGLAVAGCGGSSNSGGSGGGQLTKAQYKQQVSPILVNLGNDLTSTGNAVQGSNDPRQAIAALNHATQSLNSGADRVQALKAPSDIASTNGQLADSLRAGAQYMQQGIPLVKSHDIPGLRRWKDALQNRTAPWLRQLLAVSATLKQKLNGP